MPQQLCYGAVSSKQGPAWCGGLGTRSDSVGSSLEVGTGPGVVGGLKVTNVYCAALGLWAGFLSEALTGIKSCNAVAGESSCNAQGLCCPGLG